MSPDDNRRVTEAISGVGIGAASAIMGAIGIAAELRRANVIDNEAAERIRDALLSGLLDGPKDAREALSASIQKEWDQRVP